MPRILCALLALCYLWPHAGLSQQQKQGALLQILNKATARVSQIDAPVNVAVPVGRLDIIVRTCWQSRQSQQPEEAVLLEVYERKPQSSRNESIFTGWMFASSPALSALEHPVYDITLIRCKTP